MTEFPTAPSGVSGSHRQVTPLPTLTRPAGTSRIPDSPAGWTQGSLALSYSLADPEQTRVRLAPRPGDGVVCGDASHAEPREWAAAFVQSIVDVIAGERPAGQLMRWVDERVFVDLVRRQNVISERRRRNPAVRPMRQRVMSVHVQQATDERVEIAARVQTARRSRALAAGLRRTHSGWVCDGLQLG